MPFPQWYAGQVITAERLNARNMGLVEQLNDQEVTDNDSSWELSEIELELEPNAVYFYWLGVSYSAGDGGFAWSWSSTGVTLASFTIAYNRDTASGINNGGPVILRRPANTTPRVAGGSGSSNFNSAADRGTITTSGGTPTLALQFWQDSADSSPTILRGGNQTRLVYQRIG
ncbi:hypothetical protein [Nocardiopsis salina]|uniref:hypothetical protein n=1 Tax=Nocardiopsis salina TaxID=245836 RepID=UPI00034DDC20|nr:hypothetical protein [Nocardiopsis salina]